MHCGFFPLSNPARVRYTGINRVFTGAVPHVETGRSPGWTWSGDETVTDADLEDAFEQATALLLYTNRIGRFVTGRVFVLHWPAKRDAFLLEAIDCTEYSGFYWIQRSDPSLIIKPA